MIQGPKAILASSIATALDEYFEVDKDTIESTLMGIASIVLKDLKLRPRITQLPNSWATIEGHVTRAEFKWIWGPAGNWVQNATLTIQGLDITTTITEENPDPEPPKKRPSLVETMEENAKPYAATPDEIETQGGIRGYIQRQVQQIIDSMKLRVEDYKLTLVLPKQHTTTTDTIDDSEAVEVEQDQASVSIEIQGEVLELISLGRLIPTNPDVSGSSLQQDLILQNFLMQIKANDKLVPLVEQFSYKASTQRTGGKRFDRLTENLQFQGHGGDLKVHLGHRQLKTLSYMGVLLMAPPSDTPREEPPKKPPQDHTIAEGNSPSHFDFDLGLLQLTLDTTQMDLPNAKFVYQADGTIMKLEADGFSLYQSHSDVQVKVSQGMQANLLHPQTLQIGSIDEIIVPYTAKLVKPVINTKVVKEGESYAIEFVDDVELEMLKGKEEEEEKPPTTSVSIPAKHEAKKKNDEQPEYRANVVPFPMSVSMKHLVVTKEEDDNRTHFSKLYAFANPTAQGTEFAVDLGKLENYLLCLEDSLLAGKLDQPNQINNFRLSAAQVQVTAGHSPSEWAAAFQPKGTAEEKEAYMRKKAEQAAANKKDLQRMQSQNSQASPPMKFPNCYIDPLKLTISWKGTGMSVKDTKVTVQAFQGKDNTIAKDLVGYYVQQCLGHVSDFIPNAELMGLNVVDSTMGTLGNYLGMATLGPLGGIAAVSAVDAVKNTISAGKKSRGRDDGARSRPMDVFRGIAYKLQETGSKLGNDPLDLVGSTVDGTGKYVEENKARLGGAGIGGAGMIVGGILGGPVGAVVAGVVSQAVAERTIEALDDHAKKEQLKLNGSA